MSLARARPPFQITAMHEEGLIDRVLDVQSFDLDAALSLKNNHFHHQIGATYYASHMISAAVDQLDFVILSSLCDAYIGPPKFDLNSLCPVIANR